MQHSVDYITYSTWCTEHKKPHFITELKVVALEGIKNLTETGLKFMYSGSNAMHPLGDVETLLHFIQVYTY